MVGLTDYTQHQDSLHLYLVSVIHTQLLNTHWFNSLLIHFKHSISLSSAKIISLRKICEL
jgi:hypothetical protein